METVKTFDPEKVERLWPCEYFESGMAPAVDNSTSVVAYVRAFDYDQLLELYRAIAESKKGL